MTRRLMLLIVLLLVPGATPRARAAEVIGLLSDNYGHGISNILIDVFISAQTGYFGTNVVTDESGYFTFVGDEGYWSFTAAADALNARSYFSAHNQLSGVTGTMKVRLSTRRLDFTHRIDGRLLDEAGQPLADYSLKASISENGAAFETNVVTGTDGSFRIAATPALWDICCLNPMYGTNGYRLFNPRLVEVAETNPVTSATFTAPATPATISVSTTNLEGWRIVLSTEAFGETWTQSWIPFRYPFGNYPINFGVFPGVWTLRVTNSGYFGNNSTNVTLPPPLLIAITNGTTNVALTGILLPSTPAPTQQVQRVRTIAANGNPVTNATLYALPPSAGRGRYFPPLPSIPGLQGPTNVHDLLLAPGAWRIYAATYGSTEAHDWTVDYEIVVLSNAVPDEVVLVFPYPGEGAQIYGQVNDQYGMGLPHWSIYLRGTNFGTNYSTTLLTDAAGTFGLSVPPGVWTLSTYGGSSTITSNVIVSSENAEVDFVVNIPEARPTIPVTVSVQGEAGAFTSDTTVMLNSSYDSLQTNSAFLPAALPLRAGLWSASATGYYYSEDNDLHTLAPTVTWQLADVPQTNLVLVRRQATARIEGRLRDEQGRLLNFGYAVAWTSVNGTNFWVNGNINSGYFSLNVFPGEWEVNASTYPNPPPGVPQNGFSSKYLPNQPSAAYTIPVPRFIQITNGVTQCDFVVTNIPTPQKASLSVRVIRPDGDGVGGAVVFTHAGSQQGSGTTDTNGFVNISVTQGRLTIYAYPMSGPAAPESFLSLRLSYEAAAGSNHIVLVLPQPITCLSGSVSNGSAFEAFVSATMEVNGTNYIASGAVDEADHFCLGAFPGRWWISPEDEPSNSYGQQSIPPVEVVVPPTGAPAPVHFSLDPISGDFRDSHFLRPSLLPDGKLRLELRSQTARLWRIERSKNLRDWTLVGIRQSLKGVLSIEEDREPASHGVFYRAVWIR